MPSHVRFQDPNQPEADALSEWLAARKTRVPTSTEAEGMLLVVTEIAQGLSLVREWLDEEGAENVPARLPEAMVLVSNLDAIESAAVRLRASAAKIRSDVSFSYIADEAAVTA